ncbi:DMT family transporter [Clostridium septicum]|uniref:DMT family transporter n=1 Tax=Clostridium septicum TaxID=1504 RepID=UPI0008338A75|nr:DMT family transporter [Clostridium septicum]MDU1313278.1 DMT family transporter [Clostridium septicum]WLF69393.1 DMT family transporter [Clostridium septicum]
MKNKKNKFALGIIFGIIVGIAWGLDGVLMGQLGGNSIFEGFELSPLVTALFHDGFCFFWIALALIFSKQLKGAFSLLKTKKGMVTIVAAIVGAPIGMSAYLLAIKYAGAPYASSISVIYPGVGAVLSYFILREKLSLRSVVGIAISLFGSFMLGFNPSADMPEKFFTGVLFALVAVAGWALEGVIIGFAMRKVKGEDHIKATPQQFLCVRYLTSLLAYALIVVPVIGGYKVAGDIVSNGLVFKYAGIAILGAITYLAWYKAVDLIGAAMGTALNSTASLWSIIFSAVLFGVNITPKLAFWGTIIVVGVFVFAIDPKKLSTKKVTN